MTIKILTGYFEFDKITKGKKMSMNSKLNLKKEKGRNLPYQTLTLLQAVVIKTIWQKSNDRPIDQRKRTSKFRDKPMYTYCGRDLIYNKVDTTDQ